MKTDRRFTLDGVKYELVPEPAYDSCINCAFRDNVSLCRQAPNCEGYVFVEKVESNMEPSYKELESSNKALVIALGNCNKQIEELTDQLINERTTSNCHKKSQEYAFEDLAAMTEKYKEACILLDACYEVVEMWACSEAQSFWKREWLEGARKHGAGGI